jgi:regulator of sirC expression with transglutaminase-like and TPR domain
MLAQACGYLNNLDDVIKNYEKAGELDPYDMEIQCNLGRAYLNKNEIDKAINIISQVIGKDKRPLTQSMAYSNRALAYEIKDNHNEALNDINKAIAIGQAGKSASLLFMSAQISVQLKEYDKALEVLEQALKCNPEKALAEQIDTFMKQVRVAKGQTSVTDADQSVYQALENAEREMLAKIMKQADEEINLAEVSLTLAKKIYPNLDIAEYLKQIDAMAAELKARMGTETDSAKIVSLINAYLYKDASMVVELKIPVKGTYVTVNTSLYVEGNYWLNEVLDTKQGSCMGFGLLYLALAERLKRPIYGVLIPEHIFLRYDDGKARINIEPTEAGKQIPDDDYCSGKFNPDIVISDKAQLHYLKNISKQDVINILVLQRGGWFLSNNMPSKAMDDAKKVLEIDPQFSYRGCPAFS